jgi:Domain of unknown function (DUF4304)
VIPAAALRDTLISAVWAALRPRGFKKRGANFSKPVGDLVHLISLQSSTSSTRSDARVTVNLAVWCKLLDDSDAAPSVWTAHWRCRIGGLLLSSSDVWWPLTSDDSLAIAASEIIAALEAYGIPALNRFPTAAALLALWDSGESPGLTRAQVIRYAERLRACVV